MENVHTEREVMGSGRGLLYSCLERKWDNAIVPPISGGITQFSTNTLRDTGILSMRTVHLRMARLS